MPPIDPAHASLATQAVPGIPRDTDGPMFKEHVFKEHVFKEPWEAEAFAMALALFDRGLFTWSEWAATLGEEIQRAQAAGDPDTGATYYHHWLATLERIVTEKQLATRDMLERTRHAWEHAAHRTAHGTPIVLRPEDFHG